MSYLVEGIVVWVLGALVASYVLAGGDGYWSDVFTDVASGALSLFWPVWLPFWLVGRVGHCLRWL